MSNVIDNETGRPLADGKVTHIIDWCGRKIGLVRINKTNELFIPFFFQFLLVLADEVTKMFIYIF